MSELYSHVRYCSASNAGSFTSFSDVNLIVWPREVPENLRPTLQNFDFMAAAQAATTRLFNPVRLSASSLDVRKIRAGFERYMKGIGVLADDVSELAGFYFCAFPNVSAASIDLRIQWSNSREQKALFHSDGPKYSPAWRLITTYHGRGTEWLPNNIVAKCENGKLLLPSAEVLTAQASDQESIQHLAIGQVALMRRGVTGLFHRTPVTERPEPRLVVVIDPLTL